MLFCWSCFESFASWHEQKTVSSPYTDSSNSLHLFAYAECAFLGTRRRKAANIDTCDTLWGGSCICRVQIQVAGVKIPSLRVTVHECCRFDTRDKHNDRRHIPVHPVPAPHSCRKMSCWCNSAPAPPVTGQTSIRTG